MEVKHPQKPLVTAEPPEVEEFGAYVAGTGTLHKELALCDCMGSSELDYDTVWKGDCSVRVDPAWASLHGLEERRVDYINMNCEEIESHTKRVKHPSSNLSVISSADARFTRMETVLVEIPDSVFTLSRDNTRSDGGMWRATAPVAAAIYFPVPCCILHREIAPADSWYYLDGFCQWVVVWPPEPGTTGSATVLGCPDSAESGK